MKRDIKFLIYYSAHQPRSQGSLLPGLSRSVGRVGESPGYEVECEVLSFN